jgi:hypothetical protein
MTDFLNNRYKKIYFDIINNAKKQYRSKKDFYYERHHIIPKSLGGDDTLENTVLLTAREHYICHKLLIRITTGKNKLAMLHAVWAFNRKSANQNRIVVSSRDYESIRKQLSEEMSKSRLGVINKGRAVSENQKNKISNSLKGRVFSILTKEKMKESWKTRPPRSVEHCKNISLATKGKKLSEETRTKMSNSKKGVIPIHTQVPWNCEYCNKTGTSIGNYKRWHGENCKSAKVC